MKFYFTNLFLIITTYVFTPLFYLNLLLNKIRSRKKFSSKKYNILIFQTPRIGDMVCVTPVFREIKKKYPDAKVTVLGDKHTLRILNANPYINKIITYNPFSFLSFFKAWAVLLGTNFTHSINFFPSLSPNIMPFWLGIPRRICVTTKEPKISINILSLFNNCRLLYKKGEYAPRHHLKMLKFLDINEPNERREIFWTDESAKKVDGYFKSLDLSGHEKLAGISLNCDKKFREWPKEKFIKLVDMIKRNNKTAMFFIGGTKDKKEIEETILKISDKRGLFNTAGIFEIGDLGYFLKKLDVFISVDTGPLYIADAIGTKTIDIIGPSDSDTQSPTGKSIIVRNRHNEKSCSYIMYKSDCSKEQLEKLMDISSEEVFKAYENIVS